MAGQSPGLKIASVSRMIWLNLWFPVYIALARILAVGLVLIGQFLPTTAYARSQCVEVQIQRYGAALREIALYSRYLDRNWTHCSGGCLDAANLNYAALGRLGFRNLQVVHVGTSKSVRGAFKADSWHVFLIDDFSCSEEIIIDPTFKQFFYGNWESLPGPDFFVGTRKDLEDFFSKNLAHAALSIGESASTLSNPNPKAICEKIYGYGRGARQYGSLLATRKIVQDVAYWDACTGFLTLRLGSPKIPRPAGP
jgi:hypothetical protein